MLEPLSQQLVDLFAQSPVFEHSQPMRLWARQHSRPGLRCPLSLQSSRHEGKLRASLENDMAGD
jgi:hypothetical protein